MCSPPRGTGLTVHSSLEEGLCCAAEEVRRSVWVSHALSSVKLPERPTMPPKILTRLRGARTPVAAAHHRPALDTMLAPRDALVRWTTTNAAPYDHPNLSDVLLANQHIREASRNVCRVHDPVLHSGPSRRHWVAEHGTPVPEYSQQGYTVLGMHFPPRATDHFPLNPDKNTPRQLHPITSNQDRQHCPIQTDDPGKL